MHSNVDIYKWSRGQKKTCRKKQHIRIDDRKERSDLICGKAAVGGTIIRRMTVKTMTEDRYVEYRF